MSVLQAISILLLIAGFSFAFWSCRQFGVTIMRVGGRQYVPSVSLESYRVRIMHGLIVGIGGILLLVLSLFVK